MSVNRKAVCPPLLKAEPTHHSCKVLNVKSAVAGNWVVSPELTIDAVRPLARILEIVDVVAEPREA
jgi:hypothetical protein